MTSRRNVTSMMRIRTPSYYVSVHNLLVLQRHSAQVILKGMLMYKRNIENKVCMLCDCEFMLISLLDGLFVGLGATLQILMSYVCKNTEFSCCFQEEARIYVMKHLILHSTAIVRF